MDYALLGVVGIITVVTVARFSYRLGIAAPLVLVVVGIGASYVPGVPDIEVEPELILAGVLPPLLYSAAIQVPLTDFRRNVRSIFGLSVLLVVVTALAVGGFLYAVFPDLSLPAAIALGAVVSPTDAVAATSIGKKLGLPPRLVTVLEGESLVNDASALVLLRAATAAAAVVGTSVTSDAIDAGEVSVLFAYSVVMAIALGLLIGVFTVFVRSKLRDPVLDTAVSFAVPFLAYIPAEELGASGVLAVVVTGIYTGHNSARFLSPQSRISERVNWRTAQFLLENGVFLLMGAEIKAIVSEVGPGEFGAGRAVLLGLVTVVILIVLRTLFIWPLLLWLRNSGRRAERINRRLAVGLMRLRNSASSDERLRRRQVRAERLYQRRETDLAATTSEAFGWRGGVILSWSGMRGVVTLAAAQSLPQDTPYRSQLILIAFTVAVVTLLVQGATLPALIRLTGIQGTDGEADRRELATLLDEVAATGIQALPEAVAELPDGEVGERVIERVRRDTLTRSQVAWELVERDDDAPLGPHAQYLRLRIAVLLAEREALLEARGRGVYSSRTLRRAQRMLDAEETRLEMDEPSH
ncbi:cation:proton antiporter [Rathayibacter iranicus]|uniref:Sodium:proton antiporter n=2 Tax=Rathayibacter iranicus TaxID=59737 RepID=A0AAD1ABY3_9MICO|nr:sodium:proton antiporter [Rathayibacter iranicus]AZZ55339.1 sodium:proton antiporter [Rathayibacter iranicus]MWV30935.1 sodium:proton antiporter [Rathayibacter iranicus NCPPB 2253 = VKM Ac-1602]PPI48127.1 sodium:proton antiporter [Rathayibacter iranicus]PPI61343.1 sodium:proton antiporter [Rathayibacter iranicus]PPI72712.1 sodium:proton antiporter [Rathayibacter iranicus]